MHNTTGVFFSNMFKSKEDKHTVLFLHPLKWKRLFWILKQLIHTAQTMKFFFIGLYCVELGQFFLTAQLVIFYATILHNSQFICSFHKIILVW